MASRDAETAVISGLAPYPENLLQAKTIGHMRVSIRKKGSWGYLTGSWRESTLNSVIILLYIKNGRIALKSSLYLFNITK